MEVPYTASGCDTDQSLESILGLACPGDAHNFQFGQDGDLLGGYQWSKKIQQTWLEADVTVAGPPCPPFSAKGRRAGMRDSRAEVFCRVIDRLEVQAKNGTLKAFVLENVCGITHRT